MDETDPSFHMFRDDLLELLPEVSLCSEVDDGYEWTLSGEGCFSVHSCYELFLSGAYADSVCQEETANALVSLWKVEAPPELLFFGWRVLLNRMATKDQLFKRSIITKRNDSLCVFSKSQEETIAHIFGSCSFADYIWRRVLIWLDPFEELTLEEFKSFLCYVEKVKNVLKRKIEVVSWLVSIWSILLSRNNFIFNHIVPSFDDCMSGIDFR
ncbi:uncharacterized protein LOC131640023 [Vicia villosa]|uniref:uncharacterized protein LOC131640023 n=1 Tax=Vicia villosa TaxID=3911 RepID=UPI00273ACC75|nr:uncharacterized protein LOC131640023 [Vicia villosa]